MDPTKAKAWELWTNDLIGTDLSETLGASHPRDYSRRLFFIEEGSYTKVRVSAGQGLLIPGDSVHAVKTTKPAMISMANFGPGRMRETERRGRTFGTMLLVSVSHSLTNRTVTLALFEVETRRGHPVMAVPTAFYPHSQGSVRSLLAFILTELIPDC
ncbi:hypothetical protein BCR39DRAFT_507980 [Naematelia encephala]|uniref:Uncharacterized protein n=1 Tax=Naematelia encephala TaxID=71784 RepID=A0A1Y2ALR4_9TREE|nr:hypothetical protein BCR39DRAFT_507980 [Naematelia encephala]